MYSEVIPRGWTPSDPYRIAYHRQMRRGVRSLLFGIPIMSLGVVIFLTAIFTSLLFYGGQIIACWGLALVFTGTLEIIDNPPRRPSSDA